MREIIKIGLRQLNGYREASEEPTEILLADIAAYEFMLEAKDDFIIKLYFKAKKTDKRLRPREFHHSFLELREENE